MMCVLFAALALATVSCSKDDDNNKLSVCPTGSFTCNISSTVTMPKSGQQFIVESGEGAVKIDAINESLVKVTLPTFVAQSEQIKNPITINEIVVDSVLVSQTTLGSLTLSKGEFTCQTSTFFINGHSLKGTMKEGKLSVSIDYTPGSMPYGLVTTFTSM